MKKVLLLPLFLAPLHAEIIGVEQFDYPDGAISERDGGTFWTYKNTTPTGYSGVASSWEAIAGTPAFSADESQIRSRDIPVAEYVRSCWR